MGMKEEGVVEGGGGLAGGDYRGMLCEQSQNLLLVGGGEGCPCARFMLVMMPGLVWARRRQVGARHLAVEFCATDRAALLPPPLMLVRKVLLRCGQVWQEARRGQGRKRGGGGGLHHRPLYCAPAQG